MGRIVRNADAAAVGTDNGFAELQTQTHASAAVSNPVGTAEEHTEYLRLLFIWNAGAVVRNRYHYPLPPGSGVDFDDRTGSCIFDGVVHQIHQHLYNQPNIHFRQYPFLRICDTDGVLSALAIDIQKGG